MAALGHGARAGQGHRPGGPFASRQMTSRSDADMLCSMAVPQAHYPTGPLE